MKKDNLKSDEKLKYNPEITERDMDILKQDNIHGDGGRDQLLKDRKAKVDFAGKDLDIPGRTQAKKGNGPLGLNDEENKLDSHSKNR
ncbi:hypothetical protein [Patiriisocius marinus]|uniref:hypothetical protein n=1 Tax=Patiriisocius marinus TaxID=1397112 RepID=UPI00232F15E9|nr:hypothetical protein [Patiriisocius marinus]